jgi:mannose/fructose/N-acetylgalactosamine-specific phosphotransferase system component IID
VILIILDTIWRFFLIQGSRNERTLDGLGFHFVMIPLIRRITAEREGRTGIADRYAGYFNANPVMVPYIAGVLTSIEMESLGGEEPSGERIERIKGTLSSVLTARGDYFFEVVLLPLSLTIGSIFAIYSWYAGPVVFLAIYNLYNFKIRMSGYRTGVHLGEKIGQALIGRLLRGQRFLGGSAAFASGVFTAVIFARILKLGGGRHAAAGAVIMAAMVLIRRKYSLPASIMILFLALAVYLILW